LWLFDWSADVERTSGLLRIEQSRLALIIDSRGGE
jgi:hypothetical protein